MITLNYIYQEKKTVLKQYKFASLEAKMLNYLSDYIATPKVLKTTNNKIIIEYIKNNTLFNEIDFAKELAFLHLQKASYFGFEYDTTIGPFIQPNKKSTNWIDFLINERILYMANLALTENKIDISLFKKIEKFCKKIEILIPKYPYSSLLHGDIWSGNLLSQNNKNYLIDPAIYYGHNEIELAFILMFNTFSKKFFDEYNQIIPIEKDFFKYRYKIYQLYPLLVHVRIYGEGYINEIKSILNYFN